MKAVLDETHVWKPGYRITILDPPDALQSMLRLMHFSTVTVGTSLDLRSI